MRDAHRMKEKFELSLDSRQVTSLLAAGLVVLAAVFVLGVMVGKRLVGTTQGSEPADHLSSLDRRAATMVEVHKETPLTFQDELTRKAAAVPREVPKPVVVAAAPAPAASPAPAPVPAPVAAAEKPSAEPKAAAPAVKEKEAERPAEKVGEKPTEKAAEKPAARPVEKPVERAPSPPAPTGKPGDRNEKMVANTALQAAFASVKPAAVLPTEAVAGGHFAIQVKSTQERDDANRFAAKLRDRGYAPYVQTVELDGRGTWYRVRMGSFETREAATRYLADFKRETKIDAIVAGGK